MIRNVTSINWKDYTESIPSLVTVLVIPYTLSIANGVGAGIISYTHLKSSAASAMRSTRC